MAKVDEKNLSLKTKAERFEQVFNNSGVGIFIVDKNRIIIEANDAFCKIFGYEYDEIIGKLALTLHLSYAAYVNFAQVAFNKVRENQALNLEYPFLNKNKDKIWLRIAGDPIPSNEQVLWTIIDITKQKKAKEKIAHLNKSLQKELNIQLQILRKQDRQLQYQSRLVQMGEMLMMIAHQWRQPLGAISATTSYIATKSILKELEEEALLNEIQNIEEYVAHLSKTIDDFRDFFKATKKKEYVSFETIVKKTLNIAKPVLSTKNIVLSKDFSDGQKIYTYSNEIAQVILNLLKNAEDALCEKEIKDPQIWIRTYEKNNFICLEIKDNAGGIEKSIFDTIFQPYVSTKLEKDGAGIGLWMSKTIVEERCFGKLSAKNDELGAIFTISLPK
jgi:PAS domain S-box-containing protein